MIFTANISPSRFGSLVIIGPRAESSRGDSYVSAVSPKRHGFFDDKKLLQNFFCVKFLKSSFFVLNFTIASARKTGATEKLWIRVHVMIRSSMCIAYPLAGLDRDHCGGGSGGGGGERKNHSTSLFWFAIFDFIVFLRDRFVDLFRTSQHDDPIYLKRV